MISFGAAPTRTILGLDIGGTKTVVVEGTFRGDVLHRAECPTDAERPFHETLPALAERVLAVKTQAERAGRTPAALSVAIGGPLCAAEGRLLDPPNLKGWHHVDLAGALRTRLPELPVFIEHDAKAGALAEYRFGVGARIPGLTDMVFLTFGTGIGAGIIANGRLVRGASEMAGELWALHPEPDPGTRVQSIPEWESAASGRGIRELAQRLYPERWGVRCTTRDVVDAALAGDAEALAVIDECGRWLGQGLAVIVTVLNPQLIVLGSLARVLGDRVLLPARAALARSALPRAVGVCEVVASGLGERLSDVQSLMAAIVALEHVPYSSPDWHG